MSLDFSGHSLIPTLSLTVDPTIYGLQDGTRASHATLLSRSLMSSSSSSRGVQTTVLGSLEPGNITPGSIPPGSIPPSSITLGVQESLVISPFIAPFINSAPNLLQFGLNDISLSTTDTLTINNAWIFDANGTTDLSRIDFRLRRSDGVLVDLNDVVSFTPWASDSRWASFGYSLNLGNLNLAGGRYSLWAQGIDRSGATSSVFETNFVVSSTNLLPNSLQFNLDKTSLTQTDTLRINNAWVFDGNGFSDISRIDFKLKLADNSFIELSDVTSLTPWFVDSRWAGFSYNLNLSGLNLNGGNYTLWAQAFDSSGAVSNIHEKSFTVMGTNFVPNSLQFGLENTSLNRTDTLRINNAWVYDENGSSDISRIDFKLKLADNSFIELADVTSATPWSANSRWGSFNYNLDLSSLNLNGGNYTLWAQAFDASGAVSVSHEQVFTIMGTNFVPTTLQFNLDSTSYTNISGSNILRINNAWVYDANGFGDLSRIDFKLKRADGTFVDVPDVVTFTPWATDSRWGGFSYSLNLSGLNLASGNYTLWAEAIDRSGARSEIVEKSFSLFELLV